MIKTLSEVASDGAFAFRYKGKAQGNSRPFRLRNLISRRIVIAAAVAAATGSSSLAADQYFRTSGSTVAWTGAVWGSTSSGPFTTAWTSGNNAIFTANSLITGATTTVANITAQGNVTVSAAGTITLSNSTINVSDNITFDLAGQALATSSSINKAGNGTLSLTGSAYTGGFTLGAGTVNLGGAQALGTGTLNINGGTLQSTSGTARASSATQINVGGNFSFGGTNTGALSFSAPVNLGIATRTITDDNTTNATSFSGVIGSATAATGLTKAGNGQLNLSGTAANTYTGTTTVSAGTLGLGKNASINAFGGDLTVNGGGVIYSATNDNQIPDSAKVTISSGSIDFGARNETIGSTGTTASGLAISGTGSFIKSGGNTVQISNSATMTGGSIVISSAGIIQLNTDLAFSGGLIDFTYASTTTNGGLTLRGGDSTGITYAASGTTTAVISNSGGGPDRVSLNTAANATTVFNIADSSSVTNEMTISAAITGGSTNALVKSGAGQLTLSGSNTYSGATQILDGTLTVSNVVVTGGNSNLGSGATAVVLGNSSTKGTLSYTGNTANFIRGFNIGGDGGGRIDVTTAGQVLVISTGDITGSGTITFGGAGDVTVASNIQVGSGSVTKTGVGTLTVSGAGNNYTGGTQINGGTLTISNSDALGSIGTISFGGGTLKYNVAGATPDFSNRFSNASSQAFSLDTNNSDVTVANPLISSGGSLTKSGGGTLALAAANTYNGATTINGGMLQIGNGGTTGELSPSSTITNNATLTFNRSDTITQGTHFSGSAISGSGGVIQAGSGTTTLSAANSYQGPTAINSGKLLANNLSGSATGSGTVSVNTTGTLGGTGTVGAVEVNSNGTITGGDGTSVSTLNTGTLTFKSGGMALVNMTDANGIPGNGFSNIATGGISVIPTGGGTVTITLVSASAASIGFNPNSNYTWKIASGAATIGSGASFNFVTSGFAGGVDNSRFSASTFDPSNPGDTSGVFVSYSGDQSSPEPTTVAFGMTATMPFLFSRRRRRASVLPRV